MLRVANCSGLILTSCCGFGAVVRSTAEHASFLQAIRGNSTLRVLCLTLDAQADDGDAGGTAAAPACLIRSAEDSRRCLCGLTDVAAPPPPPSPAALLGAELAASAPHLRLRHFALLELPLWRTTEGKKGSCCLSSAGLAAIANAALPAAPRLSLHFSLVRARAPAVECRRDGSWWVAQRSRQAAGAGGTEEKGTAAGRFFEQLFFCWRLAPGIQARLRVVVSERAALGGRSWSGWAARVDVSSGMLDDLVRSSVSHSLLPGVDQS